MDGGSSVKTPLMHVLPVLDLMQGVVVRGVAGQRESYRPVQSQFGTAADPLSVARAFREHFGLMTLYVADLDGILSGRPNFEIYRQLADDGFVLWVDAGIRNIQSAENVLQAGAQSVIAGLESIAAPQLLQDLVTQTGSHKLIFSIDLQHGIPLTSSAEWEGLSPLQIGLLAIETGVRRLIVLDLAQVGIGQGLSTLPLCAEILRKSNQLPEHRLQIITGGGVRNADDLRLVSQAGIDGVLIASALHNGMLTRADLEGYSGGRGGRRA
jgi:phosphoribosylformimino-5-aminoimidazole carboxamide ribotide isomerase